MGTRLIKIIQLTEGENSWWKIGEEESKGNSIKLIDDGMKRDVKVYCKVK